MSRTGGRAVVIGAGVNELVAAHKLARAGWQVTVLEERPATDWDFGWAPAELVSELGLQGKLRIEEADPWAIAILPGGERLELHRDISKTSASLQKLSPRDAETWPRFCERMARLAVFMEKLALRPAPNPLDLSFALRVRRLGRQGMQDLMRILPMPVAELLDEWFECDALKGVLAAGALARLQQGPRSAGTAFRLLLHHAGNPPGVFRPPRSNLRRVLRDLPGPAVRTAQAASIMLRNAQVTGVAIAGGEELPANLIVSGAAPTRTLLELVDPAWLDPELVRNLRHLRSRGVRARADIRLDRPASLPPMVMAHSLDYLERAYDDAKHGRVSRQPWMEVYSADGTIHLDVQYAPFQLAAGAWSDAMRATVGEAAAAFVTSALAGAAIRELDVLAPPDLEARYGWPEGQAEHVELTLDQGLWARPLPELARYCTPIGGLWLCGPAMHPGPAIAGASGYLCAREILRG